MALANALRESHSLSSISLLEASHAPSQPSAEYSSLSTLGLPICHSKPHDKRASSLSALPFSSWPPTSTDITHLLAESSSPFSIQLCTISRVLGFGSHLIQRSAASHTAILSPDKFFMVSELGCCCRCCCADDGAFFPTAWAERDRDLALGLPVTILRIGLTSLPLVFRLVACSSTAFTPRTVATPMIRMMLVQDASSPPWAIAQRMIADGGVSRGTHPKKGGRSSPALYHSTCAWARPFSR